MSGLIDWQQLGRLQLPVRRTAPGADIDWDTHAQMYTKMAEMEAEDTLHQIDRIPLLATDTVLDIGSGPGRVTLPLARRTARVTALDSFPLMLEAGRSNAAAAGLENIDFVGMDWNDVDPGVNLDRHDVVVCSRTAALDDLAKVSDMATRIAAVITWANSPAIPTILDRLFAGTGTPALGRPGRPDRRLGYNVLFNVVYDLGYEPNLAIVPDGFRRAFTDPEAAYDYLRTLRPLPEGAAAEDAFRRNVDAFLTPTADGVFFEVRTSSLVLWWSTQPAAYADLWQPAD